MLTIDDCNTIIEKYPNEFWYEVDTSKLDLTNLEVGSPVSFNYDFCVVKIILNNQDLVDIKVTFNNALFKCTCYITDSEGNIVERDINANPNYLYILYYPLESFVESPPKIHTCLSRFMEMDDIRLNFLYINRVLYVPLQSTIVNVVNGEYDDKFYILPLTERYERDYLIDGEIVSLEEDDNGKFLRLPSANDCTLGVRYWNAGSAVYRSIPLYRVSFREFKTIPNLSIPTLYKGTPQQVQLYNEDTEEYITDFQAYYKGRKLKDNIVTLDYDVDDIVDIVIDILDPTYPPSRVKLKAPTTLYTASSQSDVEDAIEQGIRTLQVVNNNTSVTLTDITLTDVLFIDSKITIDESTLTNVTILDTTYTDNGNNSLTDCTIKSSTLTSANTPSTYADCKILECEINSMELHLTGAITDSTLTNTLIISDGIIEVIGNTFTGKNSKDYFPSFLYLTGDYLAKNNTFTLNDEWTEPAFNMCIIKSIDTFNPSLFIAENTFNLNIEYSTEEPNTFYYNIVDDDKIKAKRLS